MWQAPSTFLPQTGRSCSQAKKQPLGSITEAVASEKTKNLILKIVGGSFGTIIAPILVFYLIRHLEKEEQPPHPPAATAPRRRFSPWPWQRTHRLKPPRRSIGGGKEFSRGTHPPSRHG